MKSLEELGWFEETLVEGLCKVNGQQGGTVHQFFHNQNWLDMSNAYRDFRRMGIEFPSRASFEKLAKQYHLTIDWA